MDFVKVFSRWWLLIVTCFLKRLLILTLVLVLVTVAW